MKLPHFPIRLGLRVKFTVLVVLLLVTVFAFQSFVLFTRNLSQARDTLTNEVKTYAALSTLPIGSSFEEYYGQNHFRFGEIVQSVLNSSNKTVTRIQVYNTSGDLLFDSNSLYIDERENVAYRSLPPKKGAATGELLAQLQQIDPTNNYGSTEKKELGSIIYPFLDTYNKHQYSIKYFISYSRIYQNLQSELINVLLYAIIFLVLSSGLIIFFVTRLTLKPISQVAKDVARIESGDLEHTITVHSNDEIEDLANSVNKMAQSILSSQYKLREDLATIAGERNKLEVILSGITDAVVAVDLQRKIITFNKAAEKLTGYTKEQALGKSIQDLLRLSNEESVLPVETYCPLRSDGFEGTVFYKQDLRLKTEHKESFIDLVAGTIRESEHVNLGCILTLHDVTKEKQFEEMKLDFVSMAAHELRTPLTALKGYIYVLIRKYKETMSEEQNIFLVRMNIATQRLAGLVENLLNVARIERGALTIHLESVEWVSVVADVVEDLKDQAKDKKLNLTFEKPTESIPTLKVDKFRITEVLTNLISNAINYTPSGRSIKVWIEKGATEVITHIQDEGEGIPKEALSHLFTKFFRVSGKLEQGSKGTGLGLYITKSIVSMHKGEIWVDSELGKGSTFSFSLPINQPVETVLAQPVMTA